MAADITIDKLGARMSAEDRETLSAAMALVTPWLLAEPKRFALMHGDYRLDNMLFDPDRTRITVVDWQTMGVGLPGQGPGVLHRDQPGARGARGDRARPGRPVSRGAAGLRRHGLRPRHLLARLPSRRACRRRCSAALGFAFAASTERGDEMMLAMFHRGCRAIRELDTLELISVLPSDLTQATASSTVDTVVTPSGSAGRSTITTATPSAAAASSFGRVIVAAAVLGHQRVDAVLAQQRQLVVVAVRPARQHELVAARQGRRRPAR